MFGANIKTPRRLLSFDDALKKYNSIKPIRGREDQNTRPLVDRRSDTLTIRQGTNGDIIVRFYYTDVVVYHTNGTITLTPYTSKTTNTVVNSLLAPNVWAHWSDRDYRLPDYITCVGGKYYNTPSYALVEPSEGNWRLIGGSEPMTVPTINRAEAKEVLAKHRYNDYKLWVETQLRLGIDLRSNGRYLHNDTTPAHEVVSLLDRGEKGWRDLIGQSSVYRRDINHHFDHVRKSIYKYEMVYDEVVVPFFDDYTAMQSAFRKVRSAG